MVSRCLLPRSPISPGGSPRDRAVALIDTTPMRFLRSCDTMAMKSSCDFALRFKASSTLAHWLRCALESFVRPEARPGMPSSFSWEHENVYRRRDQTSGRRPHGDGVFPGVFPLCARRLRHYVEIMSNQRPF